MTYDSSNREEIESLDAQELVRRIREAMSMGCIHPCHVYDMVDEVLHRYILMIDENECLETDCKRLRNGLVAQCHCRHFKGLHNNEYSDCLVVCDKYDHDYVSLDACQHCEDADIVIQQKN